MITCDNSVFFVMPPVNGADVLRVSEGATVGEFGVISVLFVRPVATVGGGVVGVAAVCAISGKLISFDSLVADVGILVSFDRFGAVVGSCSVLLSLRSCSCHHFLFGLVCCETAAAMCIIGDAEADANADADVDVVSVGGSEPRWSGELPPNSVGRDCCAVTKSTKSGDRRLPGCSEALRAADADLESGSGPRSPVVFSSSSWMRE